MPKKRVRTAYMKTFRETHREWIREYTRKWRNKNRKQMRKLNKKSYRVSIKKYPFLHSFQSAKQRCNNPKNIAYRWYGANGIKFMLSLSELQQLWDRDKAHKLKKHSLDRINPTGHYEFNNCRFIEQSENLKNANDWKRRHNNAEINDRLYGGSH